MEFTKKFSEILKDEKINQTELAKKLNTTKQAITNMKNGTSLPSLDMLCNISKTLNYSTDFLLGLEDETERKTCQTCANTNDVKIGSTGTINNHNK